jgi:hypothetical protein
MLSAFFKSLGLHNKRSAHASSRRHRFTPLIETLEKRELLSASNPTAGVAWTEQIGFHGHYDSSHIPVASDFKVEIHWGDGTTTQATSITEEGNTDEFTATATHTYTTPGNTPQLFEVDITNTHDNLSWVQESYGVTVDAAPNLQALASALALTQNALHNPALAAGFGQGQDAVDLASQSAPGAPTAFTQAWTAVLEARPLEVEAMNDTNEAQQTSGSEQSQLLQQAQDFVTQAASFVLVAQNDLSTLEAQQSTPPSQPQPIPPAPVPPATATPPAPAPQPKPPAPVPPSTVTPPAPQAELPAINSAILQYCNAQIGQRVGSGECSDLATEALRVAGASFDAPNNVWGTPVTEITNGKVTLRGSIQAGDIIQFSDPSTGGQHTAIVDTVDPATGLPSLIYEQNVAHPNPNNPNGAWLTTNMRQVYLNPRAYQFGTGTGHYQGTITIYQPIARTAIPGRTEFTIVNNTNKAITIQGTGGAFSLTADNTSGSFETRWVSTGGTVTINHTVFKLQDGKGYEIVNGLNGPVLEELPN